MKSRRGLSTVVGMVFSIIALTSTVAYVSYSMNTLSNYNQAVLVTNQQSTNIGKEKFQISNVGIVLNRFNITVTNTGSLPINFTKMWVQNTTATDWVHSYVPLNNFVAPGGSLKNIGQNIPVSALSSKSYNIKLVTSRGNSYQFSVNSANQSPLILQLIAAPNSVPTGFQTTILLGVTNNMSNSGILTAVKPNTLIVTSQGVASSSCSLPNPSSYTTIQNGATVFFQWYCTITGTVGSSATFNATLQNGFNHNYAISTVTLGNVQFSEQSGVSITSQGLSSLAQENNILELHQEQNNVPTGGYQIWSGSTDNSTNKILQIDQATATFFTANDTTTETIPTGNWNASLRYMSAPVPPSLINNLPTTVYHFEDYVSTKNNVGDSMGNENLTTNGNPTWNSATGENSSGSYTFSGAQYMSHNADGQSNMNQLSGTITGWFKTNGQVTGTQTIIRMGSQAAKPFYVISLDRGTNAGKLNFTFSGQPDGSQVVTCETNTRYDDSHWHFFAAVKNPPSFPASKCALYIDTTTITSGLTCATCNAAVGGTWNIGRDPLFTGNFFNGQIDDVMIWDTYSLSTSQVSDLRATNYGNGAEKVNFNIYETDQDGNNPVLLAQSQNYNLFFNDGWYKGAGQSAYTNNPDKNSNWGHYNFTTNTVNNGNPVVVGSGQRIKFQMQFVPSTIQLGMKMIIDNSGINDQWGNSYIQIPIPDNPLPGYFTYNAHNDGSVWISNNGPDIAWVTPNTRVIFMTYDKSQAYGSWINFGSNFPHTPAQVDSFAIPNGGVSQLSFAIPDIEPGVDGQQQPGHVQIPAGNYKMFVYINGYDEEGHTLLSTQYVGPVRVYIK